MGRRKLFTLAAGVSAVLCIAVCVLWVRSCWSEEVIRWDARDGMTELAAPSGLLYLYHERIIDSRFSYRDDVPGNPLGFRHESRDPIAFPPPVTIKDNGRDHDWHFYSLRLIVHDSTGSSWPSIIHLVVLPSWFAALILLILPVAWGVRVLKWRRHDRAARGLCPSCGYDLRATPERCPECGADPAARSGSAAG